MAEQKPPRPPPDYGARKADPAEYADRFSRAWLAGTSLDFQNDADHSEIVRFIRWGYQRYESSKAWRIWGNRIAISVLTAALGVPVTLGVTWLSITFKLPAVCAATPDIGWSADIGFVVDFGYRDSPGIDLDTGL